jgi:hypothetical protein
MKRCGPGLGSFILGKRQQQLGIAVDAAAGAEELEFRFLSRPASTIAPCRRLLVARRNLRSSSAPERPSQVPQRLLELVSVGIELEHDPLEAAFPLRCQAQVDDACVRV